MCTEREGEGDGHAAEAHENKGKPAGTEDQNQGAIPYQPRDKYQCTSRGRDDLLPPILKCSSSEPRSD